ncbi:helix-turn-helix transcriptional regulator [bacterium]|nr:helix-turn-helix transcriptional regulator [bacterium]
MKYPKLVEFGHNLRVERVRKGYSLEKLGYACNLNPTHIGKIERAEMSPTLLTILTLLEALDIRFEQLVTYGKE